MPFYPYNNRSTGLVSVANPVAALATGYKIVAGDVLLDGSNPTPVATGLAAIVGAVATLRSTLASTGAPVVLQTQFTTSTGNLDIYAFAFLSTADSALTGSASTTHRANYLAWGR